jgi:hypothetical protein
MGTMPAIIDYLLRPAVIYVIRLKCRSKVCESHIKVMHTGNVRRRPLSIHVNKSKFFIKFENIDKLARFLGHNLIHQNSLLLMIGGWRAHI